MSVLLCLYLRYCDAEFECRSKGVVFGFGGVALHVHIFWGSGSGSLGVVRKIYVSR